MVRRGIDIDGSDAVQETDTRNADIYFNFFFGKIKSHLREKRCLLQLGRGTKFK